MKASLYLILAGLMSTATAWGQQPGSTFPEPVASPPLSYRHASTYQEGLLRGRADVIRAGGEFNYNTASAALIFEHARKEAYANELRHAETFWAKRSIRDTALAAQKARREASIVPQPVAQPAATVEPVALRTAPLGDPSQPGFVWPAAFDHPAFAASREKITVLFAERTPGNSGPHSANYLRIHNLTTEMRTMLSDLVREMPPMAYLDARQFLDRLTLEGSQVVQLKVAAN